MCIRDSCQDELVVMKEVIRQVNEIKDQARQKAILPTVKEMMVKCWGLCMKGKSLDRFDDYAEEKLTGGSPQCREEVLGYKQPLWNWSRYVDFEKSDNFHNKLLTAAKSECYKQTPLCSDILQIFQMIYKFAGTGVHEWYLHHYTRVYGYFIRECYIHETRSNPNAKCLTFIQQAQAKIEDALTTSKNYEAVADQLRAARTLSEQFAQCVTKKDASELCPSVAKSLPDMITRAIFSANNNEMKSKITSVKEAVKDVMGACSKSSQQEEVHCV
eukprot:TRINITY_DN9046_c0_g1_i4.p1 TRINITY_DN9046_c0_g1~~TRINITY_DN9046_c0_g1_i4.p1  ORF type:complete len:272 (-),score=45.28 TRINITY_DN9046_c0_g1_i4:99-914(-)